MNELATVEFDYNQLDAPVLDALMDEENLLETVLKRTHKDIGEILIRVKNILPHGTYEAWHRSKGISDDMASRCVRIAKGIEVKSRKMLLLPEPEPEQQEDSQATQEPYQYSTTAEESLDHAQTYVFNLDDVEMDEGEEPAPPDLEKMHEQAEINAQLARNATVQTTTQTTSKSKPPSAGSLAGIVQSAKVKNTGDFQTYLLELKRPKQDFPFKFRIPYDLAVEIADDIDVLEKIRNESEQQP